MVVNGNEVLEYMSKNIIGRLGAPRLRLVKALLSEKYGERHHCRDELSDGVYSPASAQSGFALRRVDTED